MSLVIKTGAHMKVPIPGLEFASQGFSCEIQVDDPPAEVRESKEALQKYLEALFRECRDRVRDQVDRASSQGDERLEPSKNGQSRRPHRSMRGRNDRYTNGRRSNGNGRTNGSTEASPKQLNYLRSLANADGMGYRGLADMAMSAFGKEVLHLSKAEASELISQLKPESRE